MGISVKWTFENESIFYAGEPFIIYLTLSCTADVKKPAAMAPQPSFLSTVMGMFSPSPSFSTSSPQAPKRQSVEAENSRRKSLLFLPKSQKISYKNTKLASIEQEEEIQESTVKIQLSNSEISIADSLAKTLEGSVAPVANGSNPADVENIRNLKIGEKPPFPRPLSVISHEDSNLSQNTQVSMTEDSPPTTQGGKEEIAWVFAQMQGNFKVDVRRWKLNIGYNS